MKIKLLKPIPGGDELELCYRPSTVNPNAWFSHVTWVTANKTQIPDFWIEAKDPSQGNPFTCDIPKEKYKSRLRLNLKKRDTALDWQYAIHWHDDHGHERHFDPKVPIEPKGTPLEGLIPILGAFLIGLLSLPFLFKRHKGK